MTQTTLISGATLLTLGAHGTVVEDGDIVVTDDTITYAGPRGGHAIDAGTATIVDSDAGQFDSDSEWDRAVGPMQFIPSTWSVVGVDADGDGTAADDLLAKFMNR